MSTIWTPGGERPVGDPGGPSQRSQPASAPATEGQEPATEEELEARMVELRQQLADTPVELVVANHCFGLFELAALHLSLQPPRLDRVRLAIDALAVLLEGMTGRLGDEEAQLQEGLASLRLAYVQIQGAQGGAGEAEPGSDPGPSVENPG